MKNQSENTSKVPGFLKSRQFLLIALVLIGIGLAIFFGTRAIRNFNHIRERKFGGGETNVELIRGWMTVDYITKMYHVPPDVILAPLNIPVDQNMKRSLGSLIKQTGTTDPDLLLEKVKESINTFQQKDLKPNPPNPLGEKP
jgi:hypothetical protein